MCYETFINDTDKPNIFLVESLQLLVGSNETIVPVTQLNINMIALVVKLVNLKFIKLKGGYFEECTPKTPSSEFF